MDIIIPKDQTVCLLGDTHGNFKPLFYKAKTGKCNGSTIIHVGDVGVGFPDCKVSALEEWNERLKEYDVLMYCIRGNHDDPRFFDGTYTFSNLRLIPDYSVIEYRGKKIQLIGGAISIDRTIRELGKSYWAEEALVFDLDRVIECDIMVTHSAPNWIGPSDRFSIRYWCDRDKPLWDELQEERNQIGQLFDKSKAKELYCGHFHVSDKALNNGRTGRILDIDELVLLEVQI